MIRTHLGVTVEVPNPKIREARREIKPGAKVLSREEMLASGRLPSEFVMLTDQPVARYVAQEDYVVVDPGETVEAFRARVDAEERQLLAKVAKEQTGLSWDTLETQHAAAMKTEAKKEKAK